MLFDRCPPIGRPEISIISGRANPDHLGWAWNGNDPTCALGFVFHFRRDGRAIGCPRRHLSTSAIVYLNSLVLCLSSSSALNLSPESLSRVGPVFAVTRVRLIIS